MKHKKLFSFLLCLLLVCTLAAGAVQAAGIQPQPRYTHILTASCGIDADRHVWARATAMDGNNNVVMNINVYHNGSKYGGPYSVAGKGSASYTGYAPIGHAGSGVYTIVLIIKVHNPKGVLLEQTSISTDCTI